MKTEFKGAKKFVAKRKIVSDEPYVKEDGNIPNVSWEVYHFQMSEEKQIALAMLEEELGIDLITLFKALKDGIWVKLYGEKPYYVKAPISLRGIDRKSEVFHFALCYPIFYSTIQELHLKDYGLTWALTKEELE